MNLHQAMPILIAIGAAGTAMLVFLGSAALATAPRQRVLRRVAALERGIPYTRSGGDVGLLRDRTASEIPFINMLLQGKAWVARTELLLDRAGLQMRVGEYLAFRALGVVSGALAGSTVVSGVMGLAPVAVGTACGLIGFAIPRWLISMRVTKRRQLIEDQLVELCDLMGSMMRSGFGYLQALNSTADQMGAPLGDELRRVTDSVRLGTDIDEAFEELNQRVNTADFMVLTTAMGIQRRTGGNLAEILEGVADTIRDRQSLRQEIKSLTAMEQTTASFAVVFPLGLAAVLMFVSPEPFRMLITETTGRLILGGAVALDLVGFLVMRRVTRLQP